MSLPALKATSSDKKRWLILAIVYSAQLAFALIMQSVPPVLTLIINDLSISHAQAGLLMGIFALPGVFISIAIGSLSDRYGVKYLVIASLTLMIFGTGFSAVASSYYLIVAGRFITGIGAVSMLVVLPQFISHWFLGKEIGIAMGVYNTAVPVGGLISYNVIPLLTEAFSWRIGFWLGNASSVIALVLFLLYYSAPPVQTAGASQSGVEEKSGDFSGIANLGWPIWLAAMSWMWFNTGVVSFTTFAPDFFIRHNGFTPEYAGRLTGFVMWGPFFLSTFIGLLLHKFPRQKLLITVGNLLLGIAVLMVYSAQGSSLILLMFLTGASAALIPSSVFSLPAFLVDEKRLGMAFGVISTTANLSILGGPFLVGWIRDFTGSYLAVFVTIAFFLLLSIIFILPLKKPEHVDRRHAA